MSESEITQTHEHKHPGEREYVKVALFLAVVTAAEVGVFYVEQLKPYAAALLAVMMVVKFAAVAMWFMHLKFDSRIFRSLFLLGIVLAICVFAVVLWTFTFAVSDVPG